jgi:hypothetical protein
VLGRAAQLAAGTAASLPAAISATPASGLAAGLAAGTFAAATQEGRRERALALVAHGLAGAVAARVSRRARGQS